jgi:RNA-splicing ligase RtcB
MLSIGTLGGGNHFIEMNRDEDGTMYLVIHSGSRHLGKQVAEYYQKLAIKALTDTKKQKEELIKRLKAEGRQQEIQAELNKIQPPKIKQDLAYVEGQNFDDYIHDMKIVQEFAVWNRKAMADEIITRLGLTVKDEFSTIHNYINTETMVLCKGAISAQKGEKVIIPINMRDGSIIAIGKGNEDWNCSAPHGAGRLMSRKKAKETLSLEEFAETMKDIYTTSVNQSTLDESPMAYKPIDEILENIKDTVEVYKIIKPIYNFKSGS